MRTLQYAWLLVVGLAGLLQACGVESDLIQSEPAGEAQEALGSEGPYPAPGGPPPSGHEPGGPGDGWGSGFAGDSQYAPYTGQHDPDPYRAQRHANQHEYSRIHDENQRHKEAADANDEARARRYEDEQHERATRRLYRGGWRISAPSAPRGSDDPLSDKGKCEDACFVKYMDDCAYCNRLPKPQQQPCRGKAMDDYALCVRECSRKYPDPRLPKVD